MPTLVLADEVLFVGSSVVAGGRVPYKPHAAQWKPVNDADLGLAPTWGDETSCACFCEPISAEAAYHKAMVEVRDPWLVIGELGDWEGCAVGCLVLLAHGERILCNGTVRAVKRYSSGTPVDHIELIVEAGP